MNQPGTGTSSQSLDMRGSAAVTFTPAQLARLLDQPDPTPEQTAVISAPLEPGVVVAGAGSGKTETMAARVVWLVANGFVRPEHVLGLTFTRKAARELAARIRRRLRQLAARGVLEEAGGILDGEPTVSTYDAYAGRIVTEHALRLGREPGARLITEAEAWQYAQRAVATYDGPMDEVEFAASTVIGQVLALHGQLCGHLVDANRVRAFTRDLHMRIAALPRASGQRTKTDIYADVAKALKVQDARVALLPIVEQFRESKRADEVMDFADRAALAAALAEGFPEVAESESATYRVVLLDEYQDTSHSQLVLLRALFGGGHAVTAVGDPCQSIYGWRGASAGTLSSFGRHFGSPDRGTVRTDSLTLSFRNGSAILEAANVLSEPLRAEGVQVPQLRALDGTASGSVTASLHHTVEDEATDVARRARAFWDSSPPGRTAAVLVRTRSQIPRLEAALRAVDLPVEVVGVGGLLATPEVGDIVATLRVIADPSRGDALMRLLTGARWRIGPRDLDALARWARRKGLPADIPSGAEAGPVDAGDGTPGAAETNAAVDASGGAGADTESAVDSDEIDQLSIVDALDALPGPDWFSPEGYRRLSALSSELRVLRQRAGHSLTELVHDVERTLGLDVEVTARQGPTGRANLDRFLDIAAEFEGTGESATLSAFLAYLDAADTAERGLAPGEVEVSGDRVQVLTVHGAKGLEWDAVFVAGMVDGVFPAGTDKDRAWLADPGELPYPLRGDADALPPLDLGGAVDQKDVRDAVDAFIATAGAAGRQEERRLAYVAVTRARSMLVCSGYRWDEATRVRQPSTFLAEVAETCRRLDPSAGEIGVWVEEPDETNPVTENQQVWQWPYDPLGARRGPVEEGAALVRAAARGELDLEAAAAMDEWEDEVEHLLAERENQRGERVVEVELPDHMSVSQLVQLRNDPDELARELRRPLPRPPAPMARRGTMFHAWLETRWGAPRLLDIEEMPGSHDEGSAPEREITALQEAFLASAWAKRTPVEVEAPFELLVGGVLLRGRADAVFATDDGGLEVVDWKTGRPPDGPRAESIQAVQLAAYRLAFARLRGLPLDRVGAAFHYVRENLTLRPADLLDEAALEALVTAVPATSGPS